MEDRHGFVYVMTKEELPHIYKVGCTEKKPHLRAAELDGTDSPLPSIVTYYAFCDDHQKLEAEAHQILSEHRIRNNREWFRCSRDKAISAIREAAQENRINIHFEKLDLADPHKAAEARTDEDQDEYSEGHTYDPVNFLPYESEYLLPRALTPDSNVKTGRHPRAHSEINSVLSDTLESFAIAINTAVSSKRPYDALFNTKQFELDARERQGEDVSSWRKLSRAVYIAEVDAIHRNMLVKLGDAIRKYKDYLTQDSYQGLRTIATEIDQGATLISNGNEFILMNNRAFSSKARFDRTNLEQAIANYGKQKS